jgi:hypothetical protein
MRLQQIAKELHIELIVLHDQDGFCHPALQFLRNSPGVRASAPPPDVSKSEFELAPDSL